MNENDFNILLDWWNSLKKDRGGKAELRRAHLPDEIVFCNAYHRLFNRLHWNDQDKDRLAAIAGLAAHVKEHKSDVNLAEQMATVRSGNKPIISGLRFRSILAIKERNELYIALLRVIRMLDRNVNLRSLAESVYEWNDKTKKDWAYEYWEKAPNEK